MSSLRTVVDVAVVTEPEVIDAAPATPTRHALHLRGNTYPVILPKLRDSRLHVAAVVITLHTLGQVGLNFRVSVPQIVIAILTTAVIDVVITFRATRSFVWPASAMLTGSGIALILRVPGTPDDHWTFYKWYMFAGIAAFSLLTKYMVRYRGSHLFNPSNVGLVLAFIVLGSTRAEPLDFWWAPITNPYMILAYAVILVGGSLITRRLRLLVMAVTYWLTFSVGIGLLSASGHCITARWAFTPVCGSEFFRVIATSPEVLIFMFFMITDPKTVPSGRVGRVMFALLVAVSSVLLMAPQTTEFGSKVALLGSLTLVTAFRPLFDRLVPAPGSDDDHVGRYLRRLATGGASTVGTAARIARVGLVVALVAIVGVGVVAAGTSARGLFDDEAAAVLGRVPSDVNPATLPAITIDQSVLDWDHEISGEGAQRIVLTLAENLEFESQAMLRSDPAILTAVDHGDRLEQMKGRLADASATGLTVVRRYQIDDVHVTLLVPFGVQDGLSLGLESQGTVTEETYDADGTLQGSTESSFGTTFVMRRATGDRWLNVSELPLGD
jgi:Na+-translocating ferredoxin:NAD+ oxidoreductase RnfD subunit